MSTPWIPLVRDPDADSDDLCATWTNPRYQVRVQPYAPHALAIIVRRVDGGPLTDWRHLQAIKNETAGPACEAVEVYPPAHLDIPATNRTRILWTSDRSTPPEHGTWSSVLPFPWDPRPLLDEDEPFDPDPLPDGWVPVRRVGLNPDLWAKHHAAGDRVEVTTLRAYANPVIQGVLRRDVPGGLAWYSFKWEDRSRTDHDRAVWAHLSAVLNGPSGWAVELYPDEDRLVDEANQFHLWCIPVALPDGSLGALRSRDGVEITHLGGVPIDPQTGRIEIGLQARLVADPDWVTGWSEDTSHRGQQRPWQPGLPTGPTTGDTTTVPDGLL